MNNKSLFNLVISLLLLVSGCAVRGPVVDRVEGVSWQQRQASLLALTDWGFDGRAFVSDDRASAKLTLRWRQSEDQFDIRFMSFFGQQQARLQGLSDGSVILSRPDKPPLQAPSAASLMQQELGWALPLDGLNFWVRGIPMPGMAADWLVDANGRLEWLEQDGWRIEFTEYQPVTGMYLARKMRLYNDSVHIRLVLDHWLISRAAAVDGSSRRAEAGMP